MSNLFLSWQDRLWCREGPTRINPGVSFFSDWAPVADERLTDISYDEVLEAARGGRARGEPSVVTGLPSPLHPGVTAVIGTSGTGKSRMLFHLAEALGLSVIDWGEPVARASRAYLPLLIRAMEAGFEAEGGAILDSMKSLLISSTTNLGRGGISKAPLLLLDDLSAICSARGYHLVVAVNPFDINPQDLPLFTDAYAAVAATVVHLDRADAANAYGRTTTRYGNRNWMPFTVRLTDLSGPRPRTGSEAITANHSFRASTKGTP